MAKLYKNKSNNIDYFIINLHELAEYNCSEKLICDECLKELNEKDKIILLPILNEAYHYNCGIKKIMQMSKIKKVITDTKIQAKRTEFYMQFFKRINSGGSRVEKENYILKFTKDKKGISVNFPETGVEILDLVIGIGMTLDMIIQQEKVSKGKIFKDINSVIEILEEDRKEKGEKENAGK